MTTLPNTDPRYSRAKAHVDALRRFYGHLTAYVVVNLTFFLLNIVLAPGSLWFQWVLLGWGIILLLDALNTFFLSDRLGQQWEERKIREYMDRDKTPQ
jgi:hypothetical protein